MKGITLLLWLCACTESAPPLTPLTVPPVPVESNRNFEVEPVPMFGAKPPSRAQLFRLEGERVSGESVERIASDRPALVSFREGTFLAQVAPFFSRLDDAGAPVWIFHPSAKIAFPVRLRDEAAFRAWVDQPEPGEIRIIQRADGLELMTNLGKVPGPDANGPSLPVRGGKLDVAGLRRTLQKLKERFPSAKEVCLLPSFGTELSKVMEALSGAYRAPEDPLFATCLVYPRAAPRP